MILFDYLKERFRPGLFVPTSIFLAVASESVALNIARIPDVLIMSASALLLLLPLRLLDDLGSRDQDKEIAPGRITLRADIVKRLWTWFLVLSLIAFCPVYPLHSVFALITAVALTTGMVLLYHARKRFDQLLFDLLVLTKYPVISFIVSSGTAPFTDKILSLFMVYLVLLVYEVFHDKKHMSKKGYRFAGFTAWLLLSIGFGVHIFIRDRDTQFAAIQWFFPIVCMGTFLVTIGNDRIRNARAVPFINGVLYSCLLTIPF